MASAPIGNPRIFNRPERMRNVGSRRWFGLTLASIGVVLLTANLAGLPYYILPIGERVRHDLHIWFKPSGYAGQVAGILALGLFLFMYLYPLRKRVRRLEFLGALPRWLDVHIVAGLTVPVVGAMHAGWRFNGLIGVGYGAMLMVSLSGIVGRYLYVHIPRTRAGLDMGSEQIEKQARRPDSPDCRCSRPPRCGGRIGSRPGGRSAPRAGHLPSLRGVDGLGPAPLRAARVLRHRWGGSGTLDRTALAASVRLARRQIALSEQRRMLDATHRLFRFVVHVVHRPFSNHRSGRGAVSTSPWRSRWGVTWFW